MKKFLSLLLACIMLATMVPALAEEELTTIKVMGYDKSFTFDGTTYYLSDIVKGKVQSDRYDMFVKKLAEMGLKIEYDIVTDDQYPTYLRTALATPEGVEADIYCIRPLDDATRIGLANEGFFLALDELYPYSNGNIAKYYEEGEGKILKAYQSIDGHLYWASNMVIGDYEGYPTGNYTVMYIRQDWLDKLNMAVPTTLDELVAYFVACRENDVNGTGVVDEMVAMSPAPGNATAWWGISDMWFYADAEGKWVTPFHTEGWKDYLMFLKKLNDMGMLEMTGAAGTLEKENKLLNTNNWISRGATFSTPEGQPNPVYVPIVIKVYEDKPAYIICQPAYDISNRSHVVNAKTDKIEAIAKLLDFTFTQEYILIGEGDHPDLEGITWKRDPVTGYSVVPDVVEGNFDNYAARFKKASGQWCDGLPRINTYTDRKAEMIKNYPALNQAFMATEYGFGYPHTLIKNAMAAVLPLSTEEESEIIADYSTDLTTYMSEVSMKLVLGEKSFDDWDSYLEDLQAMGVEEVLEAYQARYDRGLAAQGK